MNTTLHLPITKLRGVGPRLKEELKLLGIITIDDLFAYYPYRYENYELRDLANVQDQEQVTIMGKVQSEPLLNYYGKKKSRLTVRVLSGSYLITVILFNRPYLKRSLRLGQTVTVTGKWDRNRATLTSSDFHTGQPDQEARWAPVYSVRAGVSVKKIRSLINQAFTCFPDYIEENLPDELLSTYKLIGKKQAVRTIHTPKDQTQLHQARRRLVYEEFLNYQLKLQAYKRIRRASSKGIRISADQESVQRFISNLPFALTQAQKRVVSEILTDMNSDSPMNRLLQGDVGSGKTVIAAIALYAAVSAGYQGALMAPTEILAQQHAENLDELFRPFRISVGLLTGSVRGTKRKILLDQLLRGHIQILIGTHALIQPEVEFKQLGLVVTDEQHRFGVGQRGALRLKGKEPDVLYMTATPIPRTLALSVFGDMDVSTIDELPGGRKKIKTYWVQENVIDRIINFMKKELDRGRQAYVICPLIEESEQLDVQNALDVHAQLSQALPGYKVALMHGKLTPDEKDQVMDSFKRRQVHVLVSTTVVEVGVNVPNVSLMVIYDADRFGLSQLHQLRGRVGRGSDQAYCILLADAKSETSREKMRMMTETTDGFKLSGYDLKLRGPGDFFGKKQSGLPTFKLADMIHDYRTLAAARDDAVRLVQNPHFWRDDRYAGLREPLAESGLTQLLHLD
ncbi:ATP-dependent DNA helicase RecG [Sporolactobacillus shoreicorticis]|uniref:ATP-dependent DNA helicase RecG n=1 Tax=Sporolactobacillus shoreicorticis TaxID=1923877 RepID=A0ABW5S252_9BACL|nr:ATP-dependent DNA helicase RecG [Sporolactobacillus shoreicorticis]MCO7127971.1 ATP-dependent DNA helicase RecG [Sporolactobacillus shoreicorticis]